MKSIILFVEGETDKYILLNILKSASFPTHNIIFEVAGGKQQAIRFARNRAARNEPNEIVALFVDSDTTYIQDAQKEIEKQVEGSPIEVFFAVPAIESWLFADNNLIKELLTKENASSKHRLDVERLPMPEEITYPKELFNRWFQKQTASSLSEKYAFLADMNISRGVARCPSLSNFLRRMGDLLEIQATITNPIENAMANMLPPRIFVNLLKEVAGAKSIMYRTLEGHEITADELGKAILDDTPMGKEYIGRVLRVARDIIKQTANQPKPSL